MGGPLDCIQLHWEVLHTNLDSTCVTRAAAGLPLLGHTWCWVEGGKRKRQQNKTEIKGRRGERKRDLPPCLPISKGHSDFPLPLMQRFQDNGLMGKTITTWLTLAPELLTELIWKSDYYPISAHIPVSDRIQAEQQKNRRWGAKTGSIIRKEFKDFFFVFPHILLFCFIAHFTQTLSISSPC